MNRIAKTVAALLAALSIGFMLPTAYASARPSVGFHFASGEISASTRPTVVYQLRHVPAKSHVYVQQAYAGKWRTLARVPSHSARYVAPAVSAGEYWYRIIVRKRGATIAASAVHPLFSYVSVRLVDFLGQTAGSTLIDGQQFVFVSKAPDFNGDPVFQVKSSSCRVIQLTVAAGDGQSFYTPATVAVVQPHARAVLVTVPNDEVRTFTARIGGGPWQVLTGGDGNMNVYVNGVLRCLTATGSPVFPQPPQS